MIRDTLSYCYRNLLGKPTKRRIVVFESDDWGSVRIRSKKDSRELNDSGIKFSSHFDKYDALESDDDLDALFSVLSKYKDKNGNHPVFTSLCVVANPDFAEIRANDFTSYEYELFTETCKRYEDHDRVYELWQQGVREHLFVPQFHGREHINPQRWLRILSSGEPALLKMFNHESFGIGLGYNGAKIPEYLGGFNPEKREDIPFIANSIKEGLSHFSQLLGYAPKYFVPCTDPASPYFESVLKENGIEYVSSGRIQTVRNGDGVYRQINWLGKKNQFGQKYITRNCFFEPSADVAYDWVGSTMKEMEVAFMFHKPAIICTHRVNYVGFIDESNRQNGLAKLEQLLSAITKRWPDVEFMTTPEMAELI